MDRIAVFRIAGMMLATALATIAAGQSVRPAISLSLDTHGWPNVIVHIANGSKDVVRLWEDRNSWGWPNFSLCAVTTDGGIRSIIRKHASFDKNGPTFYLVAPGETKTLSLNLTDGWWQGVEGDIVRQPPLAASAILHIGPSKEATDLHVWTGTAISPWSDQAGR